MEWVRHFTAAELSAIAADGLVLQVPADFGGGREVRLYEIYVQPIMLGERFDKLHEVTLFRFAKAPT